MEWKRAAHDQQYQRESFALCRCSKQAPSVTAGLSSREHRIPTGRATWKTRDGIRLGVSSPCNTGMGKVRRELWSCWGMSQWESQPCSLVIPSKRCWGYRMEDGLSQPSLGTTLNLCSLKSMDRCVYWVPLFTAFPALRQQVSHIIYSGSGVRLGWM